MRPRFQRMQISITRSWLVFAAGSQPLIFRVLMMVVLSAFPDPEVLGIAAGYGRILISHDRKTMPGHFTRFRETRSSPGLIIVSQELDIGAAIEDLLLIWEATEAEEWVDGLGFVPV